jgi:crotonobetainyl-CoA:carnitine CoA-transferase CaiB-like acyl-CoA transferase
MRGMIVEMEHRDHGKLKLPGFAPRMSENQIEYTVSPDLGASNKKVYQEILGLSDEELKRLKDLKAI